MLRSPLGCTQSSTRFSDRELQGNALAPWTCCSGLVAMAHPLPGDAPAANLTMSIPLREPPESTGPAA
eukprot:11810339-Alexandrium_andersonii.AAC.1